MRWMQADLLNLHVSFTLTERVVSNVTLQP